MAHHQDARVVVIGLGYVGLPLAVALARHFNVTGLDLDSSRIAELLEHQDRTCEIEYAVLAQSSLELTNSEEACKGADIYIVTVPTPVDDANEPDLGPVRAASRTVGRLLERGRGSIVVFESTVYPGVTEGVCGPLIEQVSGLDCGRDFYLGYSPERINPGDREHTIDKIVKVIAGQTPETTERLATMYGAITQAGVFRASSIKAAEAAKVIENAQRDINIAFMNEITQIFEKIGLSVWDVLAAAETKWNFLRFQPGLVGGHCIGVDPYYLSHLAQSLGHEPAVILAGRATNDRMGLWIADRIDALRNSERGTVLVMGLTFKEDVPDLRNSRVIDVIKRLQSLGHSVTVHDPRADRAEAAAHYAIDLDPEALSESYDVVVGAVAHQAYRDLATEEIRALVRPGGLLVDLKGIWRKLAFDLQRWTL